MDADIQLINWFHAYVFLSRLENTKVLHLDALREESYV